MGDEEYDAFRRDAKRQCMRDVRQRQSQAPVAVAGEEGSKAMWVGPRGATVIANARALLRPSGDKFEELHRLAKLEMVLDPRWLWRSRLTRIAGRLHQTAEAGSRCEGVHHRQED